MVVLQSNRALAMDNGAGVGAAAVPCVQKPRWLLCSGDEGVEEEDGGTSEPVSYSEVVVPVLCSGEESAVRDHGMI